MTGGVCSRLVVFSTIAFRYFIIAEWCVDGLKSFANAKSFLSSREAKNISLAVKA